MWWFRNDSVIAKLSQNLVQYVLINCRLFWNFCSTWSIPCISYSILYSFCNNTIVKLLENFAQYVGRLYVRYFEVSAVLANRLVRCTVCVDCSIQWNSITMHSHCEITSKFYTTCACVDYFDSPSCTNWLICIRAHRVSITRSGEIQ